MVRKRLLIIALVSLFGGMLIPILYAADTSAAGTPVCLATGMSDGTVPTTAPSAQTLSHGGSLNDEDSQVHARHTQTCPEYVVRYKVERTYCYHVRVENSDGAGSTLERRCRTEWVYTADTVRRCPRSWS